MATKLIQINPCKAVARNIASIETQIASLEAEKKALEKKADGAPTKTGWIYMNLINYLDGRIQDLKLQEESWRNFGVAFGCFPGSSRRNMKRKR